MHVFPVETARLRTRPLRIEDSALYVQLYTDEETMRFIGPPLTPERAASSFRKALAGMMHSSIGKLFLTVVEKASNTDVGVCSLQNFDAQRRSVQAGIMLIPGARARGYSRELFAGLIKRVFAELPVDELWVQFTADHAAVERGVISLGFSRTQRTPPDGSPERCVWSIRRDSWTLR